MVRPLFFEIVRRSVHDSASLFSFTKFTVFLFISILVSTAVYASDSKPPIVASYIRTWPLTGGTETRYWNADTVRGEYITDLLIAFALIDTKDGSSLYINHLSEVSSGGPSGGMVPAFPDFWGQIAALKKKFPHLRVELSVGGGGAEGFSDMANNPSLKKKFIKNLIDWIELYDLDGADIDWEFPVGGDWASNIKTRKQDRENYVLLLRDIRSALDTLSGKTGKEYKLYTAVSAGVWFLEKNDAVSAAGIVDAFLMMCYDYYGSWNTSTGHHANLYTNPHDPLKMSTDWIVREYIAAGVPAEKIVVGVPFYGRAWEGVPAGTRTETPGLYQPFKKALYPDGLPWSDIQKLFSNPSFIRYRDAVAKAPYLYNGDIMITYMDEAAVAEIAKYVRENKLGGVMSWEYGTDIDAVLLKALAESE